MKKRFLILVSVSVVIIVVLLFWRRLNQNSPAPVPVTYTIAQTTNPPASDTVQNALPIPLSTNIPEMEVKISNANNSSLPEPRAIQFQQILESRNVPVSLYGKVIDQDSNGISGVHIVIRVRQPYFDIAHNSPESTYPKFERITDVNGRFSLEGVKGDNLTVESVNKDGYRLSPRASPSYGPTSGSVLNPVIIKMWKESGTKEPLITGSHVFGIDSGKTYTLDLINGKKIEGGSEGDLWVSIRRPSGVKPRDKYSWSFSIEAIGGGLLESDDEFMYFAPGSGYEPKIEMQFDPSDSTWTSTVKKRFFLRSRNGQVYGRAEVEIDSIYNVHSAIQINYAVNPNGSRNLEPK